MEKLGCLNRAEVARTENKRHKWSKSKVIYALQEGCVFLGVLEEWGSMETEDSLLAPWENYNVLCKSKEEKFRS